MTRYLNSLILIGITLSFAHCALGPAGLSEGSTTLDTFEADVLEESTPHIEEAHEKDPGEWDPGTVGGDQGTIINISEIQDQEVWVEDYADQESTVESYCDEARYQCEKGAEPIERAVCREDYEDCVAPSNCEVQQKVCLLNQNAPDFCQRQLDQCDCRNEKQDCLIQGENRRLCESLYPSC